jgi:hypothetical protein
MTGGLNDIETSAFDAPLNAGNKPDGGAVDYAIISIAISLKRIADAMTGIPDCADDFAKEHAEFMDEVRGNIRRGARSTGERFKL